MLENKYCLEKKSDEWETPDWLFKELNNEFDFLTDLACTEKNSKCDQYVTCIEKIPNGIPSPYKKQNWVFCNPPYSSQRKFIEFSIKHNIKTVFLLPSRTDTRMFHDLIYKNPLMEIRFLKGRLKFSGHQHNAPFGSMIVIFRAKEFLN